MADILEISDRQHWQVPAYSLQMWHGRTSSWCVVIPVINEGVRIMSLLRRMLEIGINQTADIIIVDGGSTDSSLDLGGLQSVYVRALLLKSGPGKLSAQLRCAYAFAMDQGYLGVITIDGNDKDDPAAIPAFLNAMCSGVDFAQASRYIKGGGGENIPLVRDIAIRLIHAPLLSLASGFKWTDTTQGFRAYSRRMIVDSKLSIFRDIFQTYELLAYLSCAAPKLGFRCIEIPTKRRYPVGEIPTKISIIKGNLEILKILLLTCFGFYDAREK